MSLEQAQEQLQQALTTTFLANLVFLREYDNELFQRVDALSQLINSGEYKERYTLEFLQEEGDFDVYDLVNKKYMYDRKPKRVNAKLVQNIEFNLKNSLFLLEDVYEEKRGINIEENRKYDIQSINESAYLTINDIISYTRLFKNKLNDDKKRLKKIKKFIFFGTLLGRHIPKIDKKINAEVYLVCERNLELFRLSLFTVDYSTLAKNKGVVFTIMDDDFSQNKKIDTFLSSYLLDNYILKFSSTGVNVEEYIDEILKIVVSQRPFIYDYNRYLYTFLNRTTKRLNSSYKTLLLNETKKKMNFFEDKPVLFLAGGPSLSENLEWIRQNQDSFFIATIGAVYKKLFLSDIRVDIVFTVDENNILNELQFDDESVKLLKDTIVLASHITNEEVLHKFNQDKLFLYEVISSFHTKNRVAQGLSVGEMGVDILLNLGVKELYLLGLDMALDSKTGLTHSKDSSSGISSYDISLVDNFEKSRQIFSLREGLIEVKGNFEKKVPTTGVFSSSILLANKSFENKDKDVRIYNLSQIGAYFENTIPTKIEDVVFQNSLNLKNNYDILYKQLDSFSLNNLSNKSKESLRQKIESLEKILQDELEIYEKNINSTYEEFFNDSNELIKKINIVNIGVLSELLLNYQQITLSYLSFQFNNKKQKNEAKKVKEVKEIFYKQLEDILKDSLLFLKRLIK